MRPFNIAELGFGTGLNLAAVLRERRFAVDDNLPWLSYWTVEHRPLTAADFVRSHQQWPQLQPEWQAIEAAYPPAWHGWHTRLLQRYRVQVVYAWDDALTALGDLGGDIDAWFLDGFNPKLNASMWSPEISQAVTHHSAAGATLATYTAAGAVRRHLQAAGWQISKRPGFGRKRDSITGVLAAAGGSGLATGRRAHHRLPQLATDNRVIHSRLPIAIVGAGIAGCSLAHRLQALGRTVHLFDLGQQPGHGASGNPAGWLHPLLRDAQAVHGAWYDAAWNAAQVTSEWPLAVIARGATWLAADQATADKWQQRAVAPQSPSSYPHS